MWMTICPTCGWASSTRFLQEAATVLGQLHELDHPGHTVVTKETEDAGTSEHQKPIDDSR
jgi:hypothetical protein